MRIFFLLLAVVIALPGPAQKKAQEQLDSMLRQLPLAKEDTGKVKLLASIAQVYVSINPKEGFHYAATGMQLAEKLQWKKGIASVYNCLGLMTHDTGNAAAAIGYFEKSFAINQSLGATPAMIANMSNIGRSYQRETNFTKASEYFFKALDIAEASGINEQAALVGTNICALYLTQQDFAKAEKYALLTIKKGEAANALIHVSKACEMLGLIKLATGDTVSANENFKKALAIDEQLGNKMATVSVLTNMASSDPNPARQVAVFLRVQKVLDEVAPASQNAIVSLANLGQNYFKLGSATAGRQQKIFFDSAEIYLQRAVTLSISTGIPEYRAGIMEVMSNLQEAKGNYKAALEDFKFYTNTNDSIFSQESKNKIAALESQRTIDLKNKEIENKQLQIANQQKKMWLLVSVIAFLAIIGILVYRQSHLRNQTNTVLRTLNNELDEANKVKAKFFGILSHDLRSPLANLINFIELQKRRPGIMSEQQINEREQKITGTAKSLLETMEGMLLWSKGQMEHFKPTLTMISVNSLFAYLRHFFAEYHQVSFVFISEQNLQVYTDAHYLEAIMVNLTANAIKALANIPAAAIEWKAWSANGKIFFAIKDNGPGANEEQLKALYDATAVSGTRNGLGLHIIRDLAKAIQCRISLTPAPTTGTEFVLTLEAVNLAA